nr:uncharacterized protein LOC127313962 [Lolium perenne]
MFRLFWCIRVKVNGTQEVNMVDASNGNDGNDDAKNGDGNNGNGHAMDMDPKGNATETTSNNNGNVASNVNNGVDGMQEQLHQLDAIKIGSMNINLSHADILPRSGLGLPMSRPRDPCRSAGNVQLSTAPAGDKQRARDPSSHLRAQLTPGGAASLSRDATCASVLPEVAGGAAGLSMPDTRAAGQSKAAQAAGQFGELAHCAQQVQQQTACPAQCVLGSSVHEVAAGVTSGAESGLQKIGGDRESEMLADLPMTGMQNLVSLGSSVHQKGAATGTTSTSVMVDSLDQSKDGTRTRVTHVEMDTIGLSQTVSTDSLNKANVQPTLEEVIAFGGIPKSSVQVRSSSRLENMPNVDMPQMEKAKMATQLRQTPASSGYSYGGTLGPALVSPFAGGTAGCYGYWVHTAPDGCSGYLVPGWLAAY